LGLIFLETIYVFKFPSVTFASEDKTAEVKDSIYEELERIFDKFHKYHMKILLEHLNAKVGRKDIVKPIIGN
jgi:hypothetical protein